jgi:chromosome segregation ATPase
MAQAQAERFKILRQQDLKLIDDLTRALTDNQKLLAQAPAGAAVSDTPSEEKRTFENEQDGVRPTKSPEASPDVSELRLQLAEASLHISRLRGRLADSTKDSRAAVSTAWKSSEDVRTMMEEQADRYEQQIEVLSLHKQALMQQVAFLQAELQQLRAKFQQNASAHVPSLAASIDWASSPVSMRKSHRYIQHHAMSLGARFAITLLV